VARWEWLRLLAAALVPGSWFFFSLSFARSNYRALIARWRWFGFLAFVVPVALVTVGYRALFAHVAPAHGASLWLLTLGWSGYGFCVCSLLGAVAVLVNLEKTLRLSAGSRRWQIKFVVLGLGGLFAAHIYTSSQALLFSSRHMVLTTVETAASIVAVVLIMISLVRQRLLHMEIYFSQTALYNSITIVIVGIYLLVVGVLAQVIRYIGDNALLPLGTFFVFLALVALTVILLSDQLRYAGKRFVSRHFSLARYDYRKAWTAYTQRMTSVMDVKELCAGIATMVSETFGIPNVTVWLFDEEATHQITLGASTVFSDTQELPTASEEAGMRALVAYMRAQQMPVDLARTTDVRAKDLTQMYPGFCPSSAHLRYSVALVAGRQFLGVITLGERMTAEAFSYEDSDLLKTLADQAAASLLNLKLSQHLLRAKEMKAFQMLSAFFIHDLKNLAAKLSLMLQNLPAHYDNPAFQDDMLRVISSSISKINATCSRLSPLTQKLELRCMATDLNALVETTLTELRSSLPVTPLPVLQALPPIYIDAEQIQKVLVNLLLNATEAVRADGEIQVISEWLENWAVLSVRDNGCGMSPEFLAHSLFRPFHTTKSHGLGIGMFHSKMIVEAHQGRIEVESAAGEGSTFRIFLPLAPSWSESEHLVVVAPPQHAVLHP
jgi:putative PEP-CTERM system histidine kinase